jgi:hypothetical protein
MLLVAVLVAVELVVLVGIVVVSSGLGSFSVGRHGFWRLEGGRRVIHERFFPLTDQDRQLFISNEAGSVVLRGGDTDFGVRAIVRGLGTAKDDMATDLESLNLRVEHSATEFRIEAHRPRGWVDRESRIDLEVTMPHNGVVHVVAAMGSIDIRDLRGSVQADAKMGQVRAIRFAGDLTATAHMGSVKLEQMSIDQMLDVQANMGSVSFSGELGKTNAIRADMGSITVALGPNHPALELDARVQMGKLQNSLLFTGVSSKNDLQGVLGQGIPQGSLTLSANMGTIRIRDR